MYFSSYQKTKTQQPSRTNTTHTRHMNILNNTSKVNSQKSLQATFFAGLRSRVEPNANQRFIGFQQDIFKVGSLIFPFRKNLRKQSLTHLSEAIQDLHPRKKILAKVMNYFIDKHGGYDNPTGIFCTQLTIANYCGCSTKSVERAITLLNDLGFLIRHKRGVKETNIYFLNYGFLKGQTRLNEASIEFVRHKDITIVDSNITNRKLLNLSISSKYFDPVTGESTGYSVDEAKRSAAGKSRSGKWIKFDPENSRQEANLVDWFCEKDRLLELIRGFDVKRDKPVTAGELSRFRVYCKNHAPKGKIKDICGERWTYRALYRMLWAWVYRKKTWQNSNSAGKVEISYANPVLTAKYYALLPDLPQEIAGDWLSKISHGVDPMAGLDPALYDKLIEIAGCYELGSAERSRLIGLGVNEGLSDPEIAGFSAWKLRNVHHVSAEESGEEPEDWGDIIAKYAGGNCADVSPAKPAAMPEAQLTPVQVRERKAREAALEREQAGLLARAAARRSRAVEAERGAEREEVILLSEGISMTPASIMSLQVKLEAEQAAALETYRIEKQQQKERVEHEQIIAAKNKVEFDAWTEAQANDTKSNEIDFEALIARLRGN